ncbi:hypothetical protein D3C81_1319740 [compost metagenome]
MIQFGGAPQHLHAKIALEQGAHLHLPHRERRLHLLLRLILEGHQQHLTTRLDEAAHQGRILAAHGRRQGDKGGPVIGEPVAAAKLGGGEEIPLIDAQVVVPVAPIGAHLACLCTQIVLVKKLGNGELGELETIHRMPLTAQPEQVAGLAAQGHQHGLTLLLGRPPGLQPAVEICLMKANPVLFPLLMPKRRFHHHPLVICNDASISQLHRGGASLVVHCTGSEGTMTSNRPRSGAGGLSSHGGRHGVYPGKNLCKRGALQHSLQKTRFGQ